MVSAAWTESRCNMAVCYSPGNIRPADDWPASSRKVAQCFIIIKLLEIIANASCEISCVCVCVCVSSLLPPSRCGTTSFTLLTTDDKQPSLKSTSFITTPTTLIEASTTADSELAESNCSSRQNYANMRVLPRQLQPCLQQGLHLRLRWQHELRHGAANCCLHLRLPP